MKHDYISKLKVGVLYNDPKLKHFLAWVLYANKKQCEWQGVDFKEVKRSWTIDECAQQCKGMSSIFVLGTNDYAENDNQKKCFDDGCICRCSIFSSVTGTCELRHNLGFRTYKYIARGSLYEFQLFYWCYMAQRYY